MDTCQPCRRPRRDAEGSCATSGAIGMSGRRIVIAGAHGFIGQYLVERFRESGDTVLTIGRAEGAGGASGSRDSASGASDASWGDRAGIEALIDGSDILINLAGKSVNTRYTRRNRAAIFSSRLLPTAELGD